MKKPELKRSTRASGERKTHEVAFDAQKQEWRRVEADDYTCCFCGRHMGGIGYRHQDRIACPGHLNDTPGAGPPPPSPPMREPVPLALVKPKKKR